MIPVEIVGLAWGVLPGKALHDWPCLPQSCSLLGMAKAQRCVKAPIPHTEPPGSGLASVPSQDAAF